MRQRRVGGVLTAVCVAAAASGVLAIGLLAPPRDGVHPSTVSTRSGWPIAAAFSAPGTVSWLAADPFTGAAGAVPAGAATPAALPATPGPVLGPPTATPVAPPSSGLPPAGEATTYGCGAALQYLGAYAAPGFWLVCPGEARGHQALTACQSGASPCSDMRIIVIADPCPNAYMNEASNSWALMGESDAPIDPYGFCA